MIQLIDSRNFHTKEWSGGTTTELFIYPPHASLKNLDFDFRISKATIELNKSTFTPLPGVHRTFTILDGETLLSHQDHHQNHIKPLEIDKFEGDWKTRSEGKCSPFNLMTRGNCSGDLKTYAMHEGEQIIFNSPQDYMLFYVSKGSCRINGTNVNSDSLLVLNNPSIEEVQLTSLTDTTMILVTISNK